MYISLQRESISTVADFSRLMQNPHIALAREYTWLKGFTLLQWGHAIPSVFNASFYSQSEYQRRSLINEPNSHLKSCKITLVFPISEHTPLLQYCYFDPQSMGHGIKVEIKGEVTELVMGNIKKGITTGEEVICGLRLTPQIVEEIYRYLIICSKPFDTGLSDYKDVAHCGDELETLLRHNSIDNHLSIR